MEGRSLLYFCLLFTIVFASPKRPFRKDVLLNDETLAEPLKKADDFDKDNEQEIEIGVLAMNDEEIKERKRPFDISQFTNNAKKGSKPPSFVSNTKWGGLGGGSGSSDDGTEKLSYEVLEKMSSGYELREYKASKWICSNETKVISEDPYQDWQSSYPSGMQAMMQINREEKKKGNKGMFKKLYQYILGVNSLAEEIEMTSPVTTVRTPLSRNRERHEMCFWTGKPWENRELPEPLKPDVYIQEREAMQVFVREFNGYPLSMEDWNKEMEQLVEDVRDRTDADTSGNFISTGYDSPWVEGSKRRNEVWIMKKMDKKNMASEKFTTKDDITTADDLTEMLSGNTIQKEEDYQVRVYPTSKWACTTAYDVDPVTDPMNNWQEKFDDNPFVAMSSPAWEETEMSEMFKKLYKYIIGLNEDTLEIEMTRPVTTKMTPQRRSRVYDEEMCFWMGNEFDRKDPPKPLDRKVSIEERDEMTFYVRQYGGFSMSHQDFEREYDELKRDLRGKIFDDEVFYVVGYNSPFTVNNRRNEIWIQAL